MKVYIKATNVADIQAKIAKKQAELDKKEAWIQKKEDAITKKLSLLKGEIDESDYTDLVGYLDLLRNYDSYRLPDGPRCNTWGLVKKYGFSYDDKYGKALYSIDEDAKSIYNSKKAITEIRTVMDSYKEKFKAIKAKGEEIDRIPECLKDFMNDIIARWDKHDLWIKNEGAPYYRELSRSAWKILYGDSATGNGEDEKRVLNELYPDMPDKGWRDRYEKRKKFDYDYITEPFEAMFGPLRYAQSIWDLSDEKIHANNQRDGENLILDLLNRVTKITGPVNDWSKLKVTRGNNGAVINGVVYGEDGTARVESILAGGYNIQRLHVRTLVKEVR